MDLLACRRLRMGRQLRAGRRVPASQLRALADDLHALAAEFARLWRARNRPSRLRDNLAALRAAAREARRMAGGCAVAKR
jgi:hypothetical protein